VSALPLNMSSIRAILVSVCRLPGSLRLRRCVR